MSLIANALDRVLCTLAFAGFTLVACHHPSVTLDPPSAAVVVHQAALYPETIEYDPTRHEFLLGSFRNGAIYHLGPDGTPTVLVDDPRLCSVLGIAVDVARKRLWAVNADLGASVKPSAAGPKKLAAVGVYDLTTGKPLDYVDLAALFPGPHLLNGIALDSAGNAYISDSFSPVVFEVDAQAHARVLLHSERFSGSGVNLNGLVVHPDGYLLVIKKSDGALFKVPLANPGQFSKVQLDQTLVGGDGVLLTANESLVVIANQTPTQASNAVFALTSRDGWASAQVVAHQPLGDTYPTTAVVRDHELYVVASRLNQLLQARPEQQPRLDALATIQAIGKVND